MSEKLNENINKSNQSQVSTANILSDFPSFKDHIKDVLSEEKNSSEAQSSSHEYFSGLSEAINKIEDDNKRNIAISSIGHLVGHQSKKNEKMTEMDKKVIEKMLEYCNSNNPAPTKFGESMYVALINWGGKEVDNIKEEDKPSFCRSLHIIQGAVDNAEEAIYTYEKATTSPESIEFAKDIYAKDLKAGQEILGQTENDNYR